jgi:hypothetical protein
MREDLVSISMKTIAVVNMPARRIGWSTDQEDFENAETWRKGCNPPERQ